MSLWYPGKILAQLGRRKYELVTFRLDEESKKYIDKYNTISWAQILRNAILSVGKALDRGLTHELLLTKKPSNIIDKNFAFRVGDMEKMYIDKYRSINWSEVYRNAIKLVGEALDRREVHPLIFGTY